MTKRLTFTQASIRRTIRACEKEGYRIAGVRPDGTVVVYAGDERPDALSISPDREQNGGNSWADR